MCTDQEVIFKGRLEVEGSMYFVFEKYNVIGGN